VQPFHQKTGAASPRIRETSGFINADSIE